MKWQLTILEIAQNVLGYKVTTLGPKMIFHIWDYQRTKLPLSQMVNDCFLKWPSLSLPRSRNWLSEKKKKGRKDGGGKWDKYLSSL